MFHNLLKSNNFPTFHFKNSHFNNINGHHFRRPSATSSAAFSELGSQVRRYNGRCIPRKLFNCSSLSLYGMLHCTTSHSLHFSIFQVPFILPYSPPLYLQEFLPIVSKSLPFVNLYSSFCKIVFIEGESVPHRICRRIRVGLYGTGLLQLTPIVSKPLPFVNLHSSFCNIVFTEGESIPHRICRSIRGGLCSFVLLHLTTIVSKSLTFVNLHSSPCEIVFIEGEPVPHRMCGSICGGLYGYGLLQLRPSGFRMERHRNLRVLKYRGYCSVVEDDMNDDDDDECEDRVDSGDGEKRRADPKEVDRVCKVIDEFFGLDRSMEAVLDECGVDLTHDLVVDVLERFKHAQKPAFRFFCWAAERPGYAHDSGTYNRMMLILGKSKQFETMISVLEDMGEKGLLTLETFQISIKAFAAAKERKEAVGLFELMKRYKFKVGVETVNCLLDGLEKAKLGKEAHSLFEKLENRFTPNIRTYTVLLNGWCRVKNLFEAGKIWNLMIDKGFKPDIVAHNTMLDGLLKCKKRSDAIKLFEVMKAKGPSPNVRSYTMLIRDLCKQVEMERAMGYFEEMLDSGCEPDAAIYTCLITGYGNQNKMDKVYRLLVEMKEKGYFPDAQLYNALIKLMINRQMLDEAVQVYKKMIQNGLEPTLHTYNMMTRSYFMAKNYDMASAIWEEMKRKGCCPDETSYTILIGGLIRLGRSVEACTFLEEMLEKGMKAPQLDYNRFAADFSRAGKPDILEELAQRTKFSGKFEVSNVFARWAEMMKKRVKRRDPIGTDDKYGM